MRHGRVLTRLLGVVALALVPAAAHAESSIEPDPSFGAGGVVKLQLGYTSGKFSPVSSFSAIEAGPAGSIYAAGLGGDGVESYEVLAARLTETGALDPSFAGAGWVRSFPVEQTNMHDEYANALSVDPDGSLVAGGNVVERFTTTGQFDSGFAPSETSIPIKAIAQSRGGGVFTAGHWQAGSLRQPAGVEALTAGGAPAGSFGEGGLALIPLHGGEYSTMTAYGITQLSNGDLLVSGSGSYAYQGNEEGHSFIWVARLLANGAPDTSYGDAGVLYIEGAVGQGLLSARGGGYALVGATHSGSDSHPAVWGLTSDGLLDRSFGSNGVAVLPLAPGYQTANLSAAASDPAGRLLIVSEQIHVYGEPGDATDRPAIVRLAADGQFDQSFGEAGFVLGSPETQPRAMFVDSRGRILYAGALLEKLPETTHNYAFVERFAEGTPAAATASATTTNTGSSTQSPNTRASSALPTEAAATLVALLRAAISPRSCHASVRSLRRDDYCELRFPAGGETGTALVTWQLTRSMTSRDRGRVPGYVPFAQARARLSPTSATATPLRLNRLGVAAIRHARGKLAIRAVVTFASAGRQPIRVVQRFVLALR